jgi:hypothetical protein
MARSARRKRSRAHTSLPETPMGRRVSQLVSDNSGALSFLGLFFCIFLIAFVFYILGIARTILAQEGMQDAADAASYASAIVHARGMNLLVYINWIMAALMSVLIALRLVETLFIIVGTVLAALAVVTLGATGPASGLCYEQAVTWHQIYESAKKVVMPILQGLHVTEVAIKYIVPAAATVDALVESGKTHRPADAVFALPGRISLPVESDSFSVLCEHGSETLADLVLAPIKGADVGDADEGGGGFISDVADGLSDAVGEMGKSLSGYLCGSGAESGAAGGTPPSHKETVEKYYPARPGPRECDSHEDCERAKQELRTQQAKDAAAAPEADGTCRNRDANGSCPANDPYETAAMEARRACKPRDGFKILNYDFVQQNVVSTYRMTVQGRVEEKRETKAGGSTLIREGNLPCGSNNFGSRTQWTEYQTTGRPTGFPFAPPVCKVNTVSVGGPAGAGPVQVTETIVAHVFGCRVEEEIEFPLAKPGESLAPMRGDNSKSPMKLEDGLELGANDFQIRALGYGEAIGPGKYLDGVKLGLWRREAKEGISDVAKGAMSVLHHFSVAQGEYYFDHDSAHPVERSEWLWEPAWTARLRRFRMPDQGGSEAAGASAAAPSLSPSENSSTYGGLDPSQTASDSCSESGAQNCAQLDSILSDLDALVLH